MANLLDWFKKRTEDVFGGIGNAINQAIGATGNQAQGVANNIRNVVATQPRNIQQASQNVFRGINDQYNRTALAQTPDILADTLKNIQEITRPLNDMGKDMVAKQYGIDRNQLEQIIKQPLGDRAKFAVNRPLELNKQNPMMGIMGSPLNPTNAAFNAYNNSPVPIPKVDTTDLVNDASDLYVKSGLADPVTGWIGENIVKPTAMNVARYADVTQGQQKYSEGLKGLAEGGTDAFGIASLLYTPAKAGQLALGGKAALRVAPSAALRGAGAGAGISTLNQYADTGRINPTDVALSGLLGGVANVALPVAGGYAGRGLQRAGTAVKPVARELRLDTGGFAKLPGKNNPIDPLEALKIEDRLKSKYPGVDFSVYDNGRTINVSKIVVPKTARNSGIGTKAMQEIISEADRSGKTITLTPSSDYGGSKVRLKEFYKRLGFVENKGRTKDLAISEDMYRLPTNKSQGVRDSLADGLPNPGRKPIISDADPLEALKAEARKYKSAEEFVSNTKDTPKTARVFVKSKFRDSGGYADFPIIRKVENKTLYQGGSADGRQFWTENKKYAEQFGEVTKKTGTFYEVDNGNRMTTVYVDADKQLTDLYNQATAPQVGKTDPLEALKAEARKYKSADEFVNSQIKSASQTKNGQEYLAATRVETQPKFKLKDSPLNNLDSQHLYDIAKKYDSKDAFIKDALRDKLKPATNIKDEPLYHGNQGKFKSYLMTSDSSSVKELQKYAGIKANDDSETIIRKMAAKIFDDANNPDSVINTKNNPITNNKILEAEYDKNLAEVKKQYGEPKDAQQLTDLYNQANAPVGKYKTVHQGGKSVQVDGEPIKIADGLDTFIHKDENGNWVVSEATTGRSLTGGGYENKTFAIKAARDVVMTNGVDNVKKRVAEVAPQVGKTNASGNFSKGEKVGFAGILSPQGKERTGTFVRQVDKYLAEIDYGDHTELNHVNNLYKLDDSTPPAQVGKTGGNLPPKTPPTKPGTPELPNVPKKSPKTTEVKLNTDRLDLSKTQKARVDKNTAATVKRMSNAEVEKLAKSAGIDTKQKGFNETRKEIAEQLNTRRKAVQLEKQADRARRSGDTEKAKALLKKAATLEKTSRTQGTAAGRNLQARKIIANELNSPQQKVFKLLDEAGVDVDKYVDRFADVDFSNSTEVAKAYRELVPATAEEWLDKYRYTNMLSSPLTHLVNVSSNLTGTLGVSPIRKIYEGGVDATRNAVTRTGRTRYAGEGAVQFKESLKNIPAAVKEFKDVWTGKVDMTNPDFENTAITSRLAVGGKKGAIDSVLSFVPRLLEASDRFSMKMTESGELGALKYRQGKGIKVTDMAGKAKENATYTAFRQELNKNGQGHILGAIDWVPTILKQGREAKNPIIRNASKIAFPFVNTPTNLFKQGIEYSPLGVTTLWGNSNKTAQTAKMLMGTTATALIGGTLAANDALTFAEPSNAKERDAFRAEGKQAYSFKIGDKWIGYSKMHPAIAFNFAITAAVKDAMDKGTIDQSASDKIMSAAGGMMGYLTDQSYMKNIGDLVSVFQSKDGSSIGDSISSEGMNTINQLVPFRSMVSWIGRQIDPTQRKVDYSANVMEQIYQGIVKDIPGLNSGVPTRKNPYTGQDIKSDFPLLNSWNPYRVTQDMGYGNTTGMNVEQRQMQKGLPETERAGFRAGVMQQKGLERLADKEKEQLKSAEGQTKTLSNGKVYAKVGDKYETFDSQEKADVAIFKDEFKKSDKKSAVKGDTYFYKKKNGDVVTKPKALYDWEQTDARANLEMDRAYEAKDIDTWAKAAQTKLDGLEKKKSLYDPETEQDEIDKITLQQENLLQKAAKYLSKGMGGSGGSGSRGGSRGGSGGSGGSGSFITTGFKTAAQLKAPKIKGISVRKPTYKASTKKLSVSKMPKVTGVRLT